MRDIGKNIKILRIQKNMTQDELAERLFVTRQTVSNYETGRSRPDVETLSHIADVLGADINDLIYEPEDEKARRKRILVVAVTAAVMTVLGLLLRQLAEYAQAWMARNYRIGLSILVIFLRPVYFLLLGWVFMGSIRFLQKAKPLSGAVRKWIGWGAATGLALMLLAVLLYFALPLAEPNGLNSTISSFCFGFFAFFFTGPGSICYPLITGLILGLNADWKLPSQA